jgi:chromosome partitioning related protein ParA
VIRTFAALNSKGGVGKTTLLANLGGLLADMGARTLLVDADPQPSLTKYFDLGYEAPLGLVEVITGGTVTHRAISRTSVSNLDLIRSNDGEAQLQHWLHTRDDRRVRLARALNNPYVRDHYDFILIDTQGAVGPLQTAAAFAADTLISPLPPDTPSIREFRSGTLRVLQRLEQDEKEPRAQLAPIQAVICRYDYSRNAKALLAELQEEFDEGDRVTILETMIPNAVAYKDAFTARTPVHVANKSGGTRYPSGFEVMHRIVWELMPDLYGRFAGRLQGDPAEVFGSGKSTADAAGREADAPLQAAG